MRYLVPQVANLTTSNTSSIHTPVLNINPFLIEADLPLNTIMRLLRYLVPQVANFTTINKSSMYNPMLRFNLFLI
jgi:hypothetical protein